MARGEVGDAIDEAKDAVPGVGGDGVVGALKSKELLTSAALSAVGAIAAAKGPDLVRRLAGRTEEKGESQARKLGERAAEGAKRGLTRGTGGPSSAVGKALSKALPGGGGGGGKKTRRLPIQRWTDVAVPIEQAYEAWTKVDQFPKFMHRVLSVEEKGRDRISWQEKIWFGTRQWEGRITDRRENDRIAWKTTSGMSHRGIVSFHKLGDNLTRVMVDMEFEPTGVMEKMASGLRFVKRAVQADLARFKAYVEMEDAKGLDYPSTPGDEDERRQRDVDEASTRSRGRSGEHESGRQARQSRRSGRRRAASTR
jgi:uncharacterized membrane protein